VPTDVGGYKLHGGKVVSFGVGGSLQGQTYAWSDLMFRDENTGEVRNVTDAFNGGWIGSFDANGNLLTIDYVVQYWGEDILGDKRFRPITFTNRDIGENLRGRDSVRAVQGQHPGSRRRSLYRSNDPRTFDPRYPVR